MFLGLREIRFAKGRFILIGTVISLITLLLVVLSGLTLGLGSQSTSAIESISADRVVFSDTGEKPSFSDSHISQNNYDQLVVEDGINSAIPIGFTQTKVESQNTKVAAILGLPEGYETSLGFPIKNQELYVSESLADELHVTKGDSLTISNGDYLVANIVEDTFYNHSPVIWTDTSTWQQSSHSKDLGNALFIKSDLEESEWEKIDEKLGLQSTTHLGSFLALGSYKEELGSLLSIQGFLYFISALITVSFLSVWTIQRTKQIATLRVLGASRAYVLKDSLSQAGFIILAGSALGLLVGAVLGLNIKDAIPYSFTGLTLFVPTALVLVLSVLGAFFAIKRVSAIDPLIALGGNN